MFLSRPGLFRMIQVLPNIARFSLAYSSLAFVRLWVEMENAELVGAKLVND